MNSFLVIIIFVFLNLPLISIFSVIVILILSPSLSLTFPPSLIFKYLCESYYLLMEPLKKNINENIISIQCFSVPFSFVWLIPLQYNQTKIREKVFSKANSPPIYLHHIKKSSPTWSFHGITLCFPPLLAPSSPLCLFFHS